MSHHKCKQKTDKSAFFTAKKQTKTQSLQEGLEEDGDQDSEESRVSFTLTHGPKRYDNQLTESKLQAMLDGQSGQLIPKPP
ncbi:Hypothetical predicted protein [Pelobates cultripes]|uniref:Uncharacterized protein n=1 Tax=Pelobates cultripes TaxID=61616 RepID=A0AAD1WL56_PELCU|nr:Hypothetical predicted protein [Pelobates cultripes]